MPNPTNQDTDLVIQLSNRVRELKCKKQVLRDKNNQLGKTIKKLKLDLGKANHRANNIQRVFA